MKKINHSTITCPHCGYDTCISKWEADFEPIVCPIATKLFNQKIFKE
jgi:hypothetical protein